MAQSEWTERVARITVTVDMEQAIADAPLLRVCQTKLWALRSPCCFQLRACRQCRIKETRCHADANIVVEQTSVVPGLYNRPNRAARRFYIHRHALHRLQSTVAAVQVVQKTGHREESDPTDDSTDLACFAFKTLFG